MSQAQQVEGGRTEWRYAAAGLGWGVAVGGETGLLVALYVVAGALGEPVGRSFEWLGLLVGLPVLGVLFGATVGGVAGLPGGIANALVQPSVRSDRVSWWSSWAVATLTAALVVGTLTAWQTYRDVGEADVGWVERDGLLGAVVALIPATVGGWLTARTGRTLRRRRGVLAG